MFFETLEFRRMLSDVQVGGTSGADVVGIRVDGATLRVDVNGTLTKYSAAMVSSITIDLGDGADRLDVAAGVIGVYALGGGGNDTINGGIASDTITAGGGRDLVNGGEGDDRIDGGPTADRIFGGNGADRIYGGDANDIIDGGAGIDRIFAGAGNDRVSGGSSNDKIYGEDGDDILSGGNQNDFIDGGDGNDSLDGVAGNDTLLGAGGDDTLNGGADADSLDGGGGIDDLHGDVGDDSLFGGLGNDGLFGGEGKNLLLGNGGADRMLTQGRDSIVNRASVDAVITFAAGDVAWTDAEIEQVDVGLEFYHRRTNNTKMLKLSDGRDVSIRRFIDLGPTTLADNIGKGRIEIADLAFDEGDVDATIVHELAHNWDTDDENPTARTFFEISHWRDVNGVWTYRAGTQFANEYGKTNPYEDFATSLEVYYSKTKPASLFQAKWDYMDNFLNSMSA